MSNNPLLGGSMARGLSAPTDSKWAVKRSKDIFELTYGKSLVASRRNPGNISVFGTNGPTGKHDQALFQGPGVIIGRKGAGHLGVHWTDDDYWVIDTAYSLSPTTGVDLKFAYYMIGFVGLNHLKNGTSNPSLTREAFGSQYFPVPPLDEQKRIAATLSALDDKIESNRRILTNLQDLGEAVFERHQEYVVPLSEVAELTMGSSPPGSSYNESGTGLPFYQGTRDFGFRYPTYRVWTDSPVRVADAGDTLISVRAPVGELNRASEKCCIGRGVAAVKSSRPNILFYSLRFAKDAWAPFSGEGTVFGSINKTDLQAVNLAWPSTENESAVEAALESVEDHVRHKTRESLRLAALRDALLPELLSGRIRTTEIEDTVEEAIA